MPAGVIMLICFALTVVMLVPLVVWIVTVVAYENGRYDRKRAEPRQAPYHPEFHTQLHGRHFN